MGSSKRKREKTKAAESGGKSAKLAENEEPEDKITESEDQEFAQTYHGITAFYKLLEYRNLLNPLFLSRNLSYRMKVAAGEVSTTKSTKSASVLQKVVLEMQRQVRQKQTRTPVRLTLSNLRVSLASSLASEKIKLQFGVFMSCGANLTQNDKRSFQETEFSLLETIESTDITVDSVEGKMYKASFADHVEGQTTSKKIGSIFHPRRNSTASPIFLILVRQVAANPSMHWTGDRNMLGKDLLETYQSVKAGYSNILCLCPTICRNGTYQMRIFNNHNPEINVKDGSSLSVDLSWEHFHKIKKPSLRSKRVDIFEDLDCVVEKCVNDTGNSSPWTKRNFSSSQLSTERVSSKVWFHYLYHLKLVRKSEERNDFYCPFCNFFGGTLNGLVSHLVCNHNHFRFQVTMGRDDVPHINVMVPQSQLCIEKEDDIVDNARELSDYVYLRAKKKKFLNAKNVVGIENNAEKLESNQDEKVITAKKELHNRQYFHSRTGAVILENELGYDSDDQVDEEWIKKQSENLLDEFTDVSLEEKEFMKLWNRFVHDNRIVGDFAIAAISKKFSKKYGKQLIEKGLRQNYMLHLFNLWDNSLLGGNSVVECLAIVDEFEAL